MGLLVLRGAPSSSRWPWRLVSPPFQLLASLVVVCSLRPDSLRCLPWSVCCLPLSDGAACRPLGGGCGSAVGCESRSRPVGRLEAVLSVLSRRSLLWSVDPYPATIADRPRLSAKPTPSGDRWGQVTTIRTKKLKIQTIYRQIDAAIDSIHERASSRCFYSPCGGLSFYTAGILYWKNSGSAP